MTEIVAIFEAAKRGNYVKEFEGLFRKGEEARRNYMEKLFRVLYVWDDRELKRANLKHLWKHKVVVMAHTHQPMLENVTGQFHIWKAILDGLRVPKERKYEYLRNVIDDEELVRPEK